MSAAIKSGRIVEVENTNRPKFSRANKRYFAIWVEDSDGQNERCLLFSKAEILAAEHRAIKNPEDLTKKSWIQNLLD